MTLRRAVAAIGVVAVTTVLAEGTSLVAAPASTSLVSQRYSPAGSGTSRPVCQVFLTPPASTFPFPKLYGRLLEQQKQCFVARL